MAESSAFDFVCAELQRATSLTQLEARGTVRIALKSAGLDARSVTAAQLGVVLEKKMPGELRGRGCTEPERICARISEQLAAAGLVSSGESPETIFSRLGTA
jgi:hypothetical protein